MRNIDIRQDQTATPILCDNEFALGLVNDTIKQKRSKSIDMCFHCIRDRVRQGQFCMLHLSGKLILADYFTKPLLKKAHRLLATRLVHIPRSTLTAWHCSCYRCGRIAPVALRHTD